jgi:hypothetical protein
VPTIQNSAGAALERRWNRLAASAPVNGPGRSAASMPNTVEDRENTNADAGE